MKFKSVSLYTIWSYISKFLFLFIIPVLQQIFLRPMGLNEIFSTMWPSLSAIFIIIVIALFKYRSVKFAQYNNTLFIKNGILLKSKAIIPIKNICAITEKHTPISSLFKSKYYSIYTGVNRINSYNSVINLILKKNDLNYIFNLDSFKIKIISRPLEIFLMAVSWSNPAMSLLIAVPVINKISGIVGDEFTKKFYATMDAILNLLKVSLPPLIAGVAYIIILAFFVTAIILFLKYAGFKTSITDECIFISHGLVNKYNKIIVNSKISAVVIKQSLFMILMKIYSVYALVLCMPKTKGEYNLLFAALKKRNLFHVIKALYPENFNINKSIRPVKKRLFNFLLLPSCTFIALLTIMIIFLGDKWYERVILLILFLLIVFTLWWLLIRWFAFKKSGIFFTEKAIIINSFKSMSLYYIVADYNNIQNVTITRTPLSKWSNLCKVRFNLINKSEEFVCKYLDYNEVSKILINTINP